MKKLIAFTLIISLALAAASCGGEEENGESAEWTVGISLPAEDARRWERDGEYIKAALERAGFAADLQYAGNSRPAQASQIENMIAAGVGALIVAEAEAGGLSEVLAEAKLRGIPVIAYDRLITDIDAVSYYVAFDNRKAGRLQGVYLEEQLNLGEGGGPYYIEFFPDGGNIDFFDGAMEILRPYLDNGALICMSGQTEIAQAAVPPENARARMENLIAQHNYSPAGQRLHAVVCFDDSTAQGVTAALQGAGFSAGGFPLITGQGCERASVMNIIAGYQGMSVFKDTRTLANQAAAMAMALISGDTVPVNDRESYDNSTGIIPAFLCDPVACDINNFESLLINSGYYTRSDLGLD
jgi:putative multiple sugar transport system substrate-binding protein